MKKIAVACAEDGSISRHFGRSSHFEVFTAEDDHIVALEVVRHGAPTGLQHRHGAQHGGHRGAHRGHHGLVERLNGADAVLCGGMGQGVANTLTESGSRPIVVAGEYTPRQAAEAYLAGSLETGTVHACCGHGREQGHEDH